MATTTPQELEAIYVRIYMEGQRAYLNACNAVISATEKVVQAVTSLAASASGAVGPLNSMSVALSNLKGNIQGGLARSLRILSQSLRILSQVDMKGLVNSTSYLISWINKLGQLSPDTLRVVGRLGATLHNIGYFMRSTGESGARLPPIMNSVSNNFRMMGGHAREAGGHFRGMSGGLGDLAVSASSANTAFTVLKVTLAGFVGWGLAAFAKMDDNLTRVMAHMRDWGQSNRGVLEKGVLDISSKSVTSQADLAKALDYLASSGMNAALSVQALSQAESFSIASAMPMADATQRLVDLQRKLGMASEDVGVHLANMGRLGDLFTGMAPMVGSSVQQLTDAFGDRFVSAMRMSNMSMEEAIALQGVYSVRGIRGSEAADRASRALLEMSRRSIENLYRWKQLNVQVYDASGKMRPVADILESLEGSFGHLTPMQQQATLSLMGFEHRAVNAILPLIGMSKAMRQLQGETGKVDGIMEKTAQMMRESFSYQIRIAWNNVTNLALAVGKHLAPVVAVLAEALGTLTQAFTSLNPAFQRLIVLGAAFALLFRPALSLLGMVGSALLAPFKSLAGVAWGAVSSAYSALAYLSGGFVSLASVAGRAVATVFRTFMGLAGFLRDVFRTVVIGVMQGVASLFFGFLPFVGSFLLNLALWIPALIALGAVLSTAVIGIGQLFAAIGGGMQTVWKGIREEIPNLVARVTGSMIELGSQAASVWDRAREAAPAYFEQAVKYLRVLAGFFWNFRENAAAIWKFFAENWEEASRDIGRGFVALVENMARNIVKLGELIRDIGVSLGKGLWDSITSVFSTLVAVFRSQWQNVMSDLGTLFVAFFRSVVHNFGVIASSSFTMLKQMDLENMERARHEKQLAKMDDMMSRESEEDYKGWLKSRPSYIRAFERKMAEDRAKAFAPYLSQMKGPGDFLAGTDFKTDPAKMAEILSLLGGSAGRYTVQHGGGLSTDITPLPWVAKEVGKGLTDAFNRTGFVSAFQGFVPSGIWEKLSKSLNLSLPVQEEMKAAFDRFLANPFVEPGEQPGQLTGKQGPGFTFKQISLERTMLGGPELESLDYQQLVVLKQISDKLTTLVGVSRGSTGAEPERLPMPSPIGP